MANVLSTWNQLKRNNIKDIYNNESFLIFINISFQGKLWKLLPARWFTARNYLPNFRWMLWRNGDARNELSKVIIKMLISRMYFVLRQIFHFKNYFTYISKKIIFSGLLFNSETEQCESPDSVACPKEDYEGLRSYSRSHPQFDDRCVR